MEKSTKIILGVLIAFFVVAAAVSVGVTFGIILPKNDNKASVSEKISFGCSSSEKPIVIMVSMDGFRADYLGRKVWPNIDKLAANGVKAEYMTAQYPTKTFPNHYSIATGLYPASHGIVSNAFLSEDRGDLFKIGGSTSMESKWWKGEPIWNTAMKQGLKSAAFFWVGSEAEIQGMRPTHWRKYDRSIPYETRVHQVLKWLDMEPPERPSVILLYFEEPDSTGHSYGPDDPEILVAVKKVDDMIGRLYDGITERNMRPCVNIVMTSDHGMTGVSCSRVIYLDQIISLNNARVVGQGASSLLYTDDSARASEIVNQLKAQKNVQAFLRDDQSIPERLHYTNNKRIGEVIIVPDQGWSILERNGSCQSSYKGNHGYDYIYADMRGMFIANGPAFKSGVIARPFSNVQVYNLVAEILSLQPASNNGTYGTLSYLLKNPSLLSKTNFKNATNYSADCKFTCQINSMKDNCSLRVCPNCNTSNREVSMYMAHLNLSSLKSSESKLENFPWGLPQYKAGIQGCLLVQTNFVTGYSKRFRIPLWVGYKLTDKQLQGVPVNKTCLLKDPRLWPNESSSCSSANHTKGFLAPSDDFVANKFAQHDSLFLSNTVPQSKVFLSSQGLWKKIEDIIRKWAMKYKTLHVISGSIFDSDANGLRDEEDSKIRWSSNSQGIPTHFYKIVTRCAENETTSNPTPNCVGKLESLAFVFPHNEHPVSKHQNWQRDLLQYTASIIDIENLTGNIFFPNLPMPIAARFKAALPGSLWPLS